MAGTDNVDLPDLSNTPDAAPTALLNTGDAA